MNLSCPILLLELCQSLKVVSEGNPLEGKEIGLGQVAQIIEQAVTTDDFRNQSIGIAP